MLQTSKKYSAVALVTVGVVAGIVMTLITGSVGNTGELHKVKVAFDLIGEQYYKGVDKTKLIDGAIKGMTESLGDPYSSYMNKEEANQFLQVIQGSLVGIGAELTMQNGHVVVISPMKDSPADKAGLKPKDIISAVDGSTLQGLSLAQAVEKIRGPKDSKVTLEIKRPGENHPLRLTVVRQKIDVETVKAYVTPEHIGIVTILQFSENTAENVKKNIEKMEREGIKGVIIDVRYNGGGLLPSVISIAENFIPAQKVILQTENKRGQKEKVFSRGMAKPYPIQVLMNKGSASASEILAGALKQSAGATLIGETSFGKGTMQANYDKPLGDGSSLKITIAKWLLPDGTCIHEKGVKPDVVVHQPDYFQVAPMDKKKLPLKCNMDDPSIKSAQVMLSAMGYTTDRKDGYFSKQTEQAIRKFQAKSKIPENGFLDKKTAEILETKMIERIRDPKYDKQLLKAIELMKKEIVSSSSKN